MNLKLISTDDRDEEERIFEMLQNSRQQIDAEISKAIIGQKEIIDQLLIALFSGGHCLITGAPGLAKTLLVNSLAQVFKLKSQRIQFTPDLMPADITGTEILAGNSEESRALKFVKGPVFTNILLADEINRTPPKTQAALLEAMQEKQVTVTGIKYELDHPFFVLATQNPIEMEGTYPLPEAQLDRFMFNLFIDYLSEEDEVAVVTQTTARDAEPIMPLFTGNDIQQFHKFVRDVPVAEELVRYAVQLCAASRPHQETTPDFINEWVNWGAGLRAAQSLILGAKARAVLRGRVHVILEDLQSLLAPVLRHRILINYRAEAEGITVEHVVQQLIETIKRPVEA
ncbi:MoxR family ATPase [uncultured Gimesia sp.]|uniref:AAA family ATPase n=1 Tax=uncultured Gimesia sp. TaxID=1678688 RepID=UPI00262AB22D|nr:MoxR family ATPase [uncultured Gimesia sp.]